MRAGRVTFGMWHKSFREVFRRWQGLQKFSKKNTKHRALVVVIPRYRDCGWARVTPVQSEVTVQCVAEGHSPAGLRQRHARLGKFPDTYRLIGAGSDHSSAAAVD